MRSCRRILVTGGSGFIGSACVRFLLRLPEIESIVNLDCLTYAAIAEHPSDPRYRFVCANINDRPLVETLCHEEQFDIIFHFAAETHVDRSIINADPFLETNVKGTLSLLEVVRLFPEIHFHHISTDEVYGSLSSTGYFSENSPYCPNSPYAASKAASDHFVRAYANTYQLSTTISHCSNNYGPGQHPEKFIPHLIQCASENKPLPIYGNGKNIRDWLFVEDHIEALWRIARYGRRGETYNIGGQTECTNLQLATQLSQLLAEELQTPLPPLQFVTDRAGHDYRYAINFSKIQQELDWHPSTPLEKGLRYTIHHFLQNRFLSKNRSKNLSRQKIFSNRILSGPFDENYLTNTLASNPLRYAGS